MGTIENNTKKIEGISSAIDKVIHMEYELLGYDITKWELTFNEQPTKIDYRLYSRVYVFNGILDVLVTKQVLMKLNKLTEPQLKDPNLILTGFLILKYPFSAIPQAY